MLFQKTSDRTSVRGYLLEPDNTRAESQKAEMKLLRTRIDDTLRINEQKLPETEKDAFRDCVLLAHL